MLEAKETKICNSIFRDSHVLLHVTVEGICVLCISQVAVLRTELVGVLVFVLLIVAVTVVHALLVATTGVGLSVKNNSLGLFVWPLKSRTTRLHALFLY